MFDQSSLVRLADVSKFSDLEPLYAKQGQENKVVACPRVGLNLQMQFDAQKELYWMADYRFISRPDLLPRSDSLNLVQFSMLMKDEKPDDIVARVGKCTANCLDRHKAMLEEF